MPGDPQPNDVELRRVLTELASGRLLVDDAFRQVKRLSAAEAAAAAQGVAGAKGRTPQKARSAVVVVGVILALIGGSFAVVGGAFAWKSLRFETAGKRADGVIVRLVRGGKKNGGKPVAQYFVDGKPFETTGAISSSPPAFRVGEKVQVLYNPADPTDAQIDGFIERWLFPLIFGGLGGVLGLVGVLMLLGKLLGRLLRPANLEDARFSPE